MGQRDGQTDGSRYRLTPPPTEGGIITSVLALGRTGRDVRWLRQDKTKFTEILPPNTGSLQQNKIKLNYACVCANPWCVTLSICRMGKTDRRTDTGPQTDTLRSPQDAAAQ